MEKCSLISTLNVIKHTVPYMFVSCSFGRSDFVRCLISSVSRQSKRALTVMFTYYLLYLLLRVVCSFQKGQAAFCRSNSKGTRRLVAFQFENLSYSVYFVLLCPRWRWSHPDSLLRIVGFLDQHSKLVTETCVCWSIICQLEMFVILSIFQYNVNCRLYVNNTSISTTKSTSFSPPPYKVHVPVP